MQGRSEAWGCELDQLGEGAGSDDVLLLGTLQGKDLSPTNMLMLAVMTVLFPYTQYHFCHEHRKC